MEHKLLPLEKLQGFFKNATFAQMEQSRKDMTQTLHKTSKLIDQVRKGIL